MLKAHVCLRMCLFALRICLAPAVIIPSLAGGVAMAAQNTTNGPLTITMAANPNPVASGGQLTFTITVLNTGGPALNNAVLTSSFDKTSGIGTPALLQITTSTGSCSQNSSLVTCTAATLGGKSTWTVTVTGRAAAPNGTTISNTAYVTATKGPQSYVAAAGVAVAVSCGAGAAQGSPDLLVEALSVHATLPNASGERQVTASFRITNCGTANAAATLTSVNSATGDTILATPPLRPDAVAFFGTTTTTTRTDFTITVTADAAKQLHESSLANNTASYRFLVGEAAVGRWRPLGPSAIVSSIGRAFEVGRITTIAIDPTSTDIVYAGARATGLWKTVDAGAHWEPLTDALPSVNINAVAVDPADRLHVFIASPAGIYGSTDGGHVWTLLSGQDLQPRATDGGALIVNHIFPVFSPLTEAATIGDAGADSAALTFASPLSELRLYLTSANGLRISHDGGVTWDPPALGAGGVIQSLLQDRANSFHLLATVAASAEAGVYETLSGGITPQSWQKLGGCPLGPLPAFTASTGLWVAQSGATQWVSVKNGAQHELWRTTNQTCIVNGRIEHVWERLSSGDQTPCINLPANTDSTWSFLYADPTNSQIVYKGGVKLCRSTDGGATFQAVGGIHVDQHALAFPPIAPGTVLLGNDGGLFKSTDRGQSFAFNAEGMHITEFLDMDHGGFAPRVILGGSQDNGLSAGDEISSRWVDLPTDFDGDRAIIEIDPLDRNVQYTMGQAIDHFTRLENGLRDASFDTSGIPEGCLTYSETPALFNQFIATTSTEWHLLFTASHGCNGGLWGWGTATNSQWQALFTPPDGEAFTRVLYDAAIGGLFVAGGDRGSVYINFSPDAMANVWTAPRGLEITSIVRDFGKSSASYFVSLAAPDGAGRIFEISPEAPLRFHGVDITANLPAAFVMTLAYNPIEDALYAGTRGQGIFRGTRDNSGQWTWQSFNNGIPQGAVVTKLRVNQRDGTVYAGTFGRGAFALDTVSIF